MAARQVLIEHDSGVRQWTSLHHFEWARQLPEAQGWATPDRVRAYGWMFWFRGDGHGNRGYSRWLVVAFLKCVWDEVKWPVERCKHYYHFTEESQQRARLLAILYVLAWVAVAALIVARLI